MVVMKMTHMKHIPEYCEDCTYYVCKPHPYKGWTNGCELCMQCLDDDQEEGWIYDGNGRPKNCPLMEVDKPPVTPKSKTGQWIRMSDLSEQEDDRYKCSHCGNVIHHKNKMNLYTFNSWCGRCGSDNGRK